MRCRRICRELLWLARFGEFGPSSQPHLDHLSRCQHCRDEVGYDREMVRQLREALAARIEGMEPSPMAWEGVLHRALAPEPGRIAAWFRRRTGVVGRMRTATALAGSSLALVLALNMEVVPVAPSADAETDPAVTSLAQVPRMPTGRTALVAITPNSVGASTTQPDPEAVMTDVGARISPPPVTTVDEPSDDEVPTEFTVVFAPPAGQQPSPVDLPDEVVRSAPGSDDAPGAEDPSQPPADPAAPGEPF